jgi:DNA polymerase III sliding clamp (beta) subunit (PCNA family)
MKAAVDAEQFQKALKKVLLASCKHATLPILGNAMAQFQGDTCTLTCTNLKQWCQVTIPASGDQFACLLENTRYLLSACKHYSGRLELTYQADLPPERCPGKTSLDGSLFLRCGVRESQMRVMSKDDFPDVPEVEALQAYDVSPDSLYQRFERIKYAITVDTSRPTRDCVRFLDTRMVTVDGYRLALSKDPSLTVKEKFLVPAEAMCLLPAFEKAPCRLVVGEQYVAFSNETVRVVSRIPAMDDLDIDAVVSRPSSEECTVSVNDFIGELNYLSEFINSRNRTPIRFEGGILSLHTPYGVCTSQLRLSSPMNTVIGFNARYMQEGLKQFQAKKTASVVMKMTSPCSPIVLTDNADDLALVLPCRLRDAA